MPSSGYTEEFKARVRALYSREVHPELDAILEGTYPAWDLGKLLKEGSQEYSITPEHILLVESVYGLLTLHTKAQMIIDRNQIYQDWLANAPGVNIDSREMAKEWLNEKKADA